MKQISQNYKTGTVRLESVSAPALRPGGVLVRTHYSVVSAGTEGMKVKEGKMSYLGKARARPDQLKKVLDTVRQQGLTATYQKVMNKLDKLTPLGYSISGEVVAVGSGAEEFRVGQRVACAGAGYANHAEVNFIPKNLVVPVPNGVPMKHAAFATVGAIALQGFRQAQIQLGEIACVIGLGLLGQLLVQILRAGGIQVIGIDPVPSRCESAVRCGAAAATGPADPMLPGVVARLSGGHGADAVFLTAGGRENGPLELAVELARDRARVIDIGKTRLDLPWNDCYLKELDFRFSRSYGPGRYDPVYEERGIDYPIGYVRWTERRNLGAFLDLVAQERVQLEPIISSVRPFEEAERVYEEIAEGKADGVATVFEYAHRVEASAPRTIAGSQDIAPRPQGAVRLGVIGAGNYAQTMLLPHLSRNKGVVLHTVATASGLSAKDAARKFGFHQTTTDYRQVLADPGIDGVLIATRHSAHAHMAAEALRAGKAVYVEKPLALSMDGLRLIGDAVRESGNTRLMVGFNRRFSPIVDDIAARFARLGAPLTVYYRVHAGRLEVGSWYLDRGEGSRFAGEGGHFIDVITHICKSRPVSVYACALHGDGANSDDPENIAVVVQYENGSVGNILYLTQGGAQTPKEYLEVFGGGRTVQMHNFESVIYYEGERSSRSRYRMNKGQKEELQAYVERIQTGRSMPIPLQDLFDTTLVTIAAGESVRRSAPMRLRELYELLDAEVEPIASRPVPAAGRRLENQ